MAVNEATATDAKMTLAERLRSLRMEKGWTQRKFCTKVGLDHTQYNRYEKGDRAPSVETITKLAEALGVSVDYLLEGKEEDAAKANLADKDLLRMFEGMEQLPAEKKNALKIVIETMIREAQHARIS